MIEAGFSVHDAETAWTAFAELRATYAGTLNAIAVYFHIPPAQWVGDRSPVRRHGGKLAR